MKIKRITGLYALGNGEFYIERIMRRRMNVRMYALVRIHIHVRTRIYRTKIL